MNEWLNNQVKNDTLKAFRIGCDEKNYRILRSLPTTIEDIMKELQITKMPTNARVNALEEVGLLKRHRGTGKIESSTITLEYLKQIILFCDFNRNFNSKYK